ncbi:MAG: hypothetical protein R2828_29050 [Saprospiraceae bacterium]
MQLFKKNAGLAFLLLCCFSWNLNSQTAEVSEETGFPGDNFSLEGALELFKKAKSPEDFEKALNTEDNYVNNLDLNEDGEIDYIRVVDHMEGDVHAIVLQVPISETESQDIAVIEIEKTGPNGAVLQIIGDEEVYGETTIVEPFAIEAENGKGGGPDADLSFKRLVINVWIWPSVRFVYGPRYTLWVSPFAWRVYPRWWSPWRPHPFSWYSVKVRPYRTSFRVVNTHRVVHAHKVYVPQRRTSTTVVKKTTVVRTNRGTAVKRTTTVQGQQGSVGATRSKTTTTGVRTQNGAAAKKSTTTTTAVGRGREGAVVGKRQTTTTTQARSRNGNAAAKRTTKTTTVKRKRKN